VLCVDQFDEARQIFMATQRGVVKKTALSHFSNPKKAGIIAISLDEGDTLIRAGLCRAGQEIVMGTRDGMAIRFPESEVRSMGRVAHGVGGIHLREGDQVVDMVVVNPGAEGEGPPAGEGGSAESESAALPGEPSGKDEEAPTDGPASADPGGADSEGAGEDLPGAEGATGPEPAGVTLVTVCENGYGKRTVISEYRLQGRNGHGIINIRTSDRNGKVVGLKAVTTGDDIVLITSLGQVIRMPVSSFRAIGRATQGVRLIKLKEGDRLVSVEKVAAEDKDSAVEGEPAPAPEGGTPEIASEGQETNPESSGETPAGETGDHGEGMEETNEL
jgi:DNA gyrase subunit A